MGAEGVSDTGSAGVNQGPGPLRSASSTAAATWALFAGILLLMLGNGLQGTLVGLRSESAGFSTQAIGVVMTCYFAGFLAGSRIVSKALSNVGHIRVFAALASVASSATLIYLLNVNPLTWGAMRFTTGLCMAGLYVVAESWLNDLATNANRGRLLSVYMVITMGGVALGSFMLNLTDPFGFELFVVASVLISLALVPVSLSAASAPPARVPVPMSIRQLAGLVPTGIAVSLLVGMSHGALMGMGAAYASRAGLGAGQVSLFLGAPMLGSIVLQLPIGTLSDKVPRRGVLFAVSAGASICAAVVSGFEPGGLASFGMMFLLGGLSFPLYSLGIAYTNDWIDPSQILAASSALVGTNGVGAVIGPVLAATMMSYGGIHMYFIVLAITHGAIAVYLAFRIVTRDGVALIDQRRFVVFPARASAVAVNLFARRKEVSPKEHRRRR